MMLPCTSHRFENFDKVTNGDFKGHFAKDSHYDAVISETSVAHNSSGELVFALVKAAVPLEIIGKAWAYGLGKWMPKTDNRQSTTGTKKIHERKKDGTYSRTMRVQREDQVYSGVAGYFDRYPRIPYCRKCAFNEQHPLAWKYMAEMAEYVSQVQRQFDPESFESLGEICKKTHEDFLIGRSQYTTLTVNKNFQTAYHIDGKNAHTRAAMLYVRQGNIKGGLVVLPEYRKAIQMDTGDVLIFRNQEDYHGNTNIVPMTKGAQRCTIVHYFRQGMAECGSAEEELERAKNRSTEQL